MKTLKLLTFLTILTCITSCSDDDNVVVLKVESKTITNLKAEQTSDYTTNPPTISGDFIKFSFMTGETTTTDDWDIAFRGTTILVNGGSSQGANSEPARTGNAAAYITDGTMATITEVNTTLFSQDSAEALAIPTGSGNGWYTYSGPPTHLISPTAGKILVFRTRTGTYAKLEILSYYKDGDVSSDSQHYTFNYVYQPNEGVTSF